MVSYTVQARVSHELKNEADNIFISMGLTTSDAIRLFLQQSVNVGGLPFQPFAKQPSRETIKAIEELKNKKGKKFNKPGDLFKDLEI